MDISSLSQYIRDVIELACTSALMKNEVIKFTLLRAEGIPRARVVLSRICLSADHRVVDGNLPMQHLFQLSFDAMVAQVQ